MRGMTGMNKVVDAYKDGNMVVVHYRDSDSKKIKTLYIPEERMMEGR